MPGFPAKFSTMQTPVRKAAPLLGEDTDAILSGVLGLDEKTIAALKEKHIVEQHEKG